MNMEQVDKLLEKYEQGMTSSEEEAYLIKQLGDSELWFQYIKKQKKIAPKYIENEIWSVIQSDKRRKSRTLFKVISVAASVLLLISILWITNPLHQNKMSYQEKIATLNEALTMISNSEINSPEKEILYEDDIIIIYKE